MASRRPTLNFVTSDSGLLVPTVVDDPVSERADITFDIAPATTDGWVLTSEGGIVGWAPPDSGGGASVATDPIWDAKGDLAAASGADAASRLAVGTNGQVLTADSGQTLGMKWATPAAQTTVANDTIWDAKGDLAGGTGADAAARLAIGANGTILVADSTQTTGMKWATPSAAGASDWDTVITKSADETVTNSTTIQDDDQLQFAATNGAVYVFQIGLGVHAGGSVGIQWEMGEDSTARGAVHRVAISGATAVTAAAVVAFGTVNISTGPTGISDFAVLFNGHFASAGGTFKFRWAQNSASTPSPTTVKAGSWLRYKRIF